MESPHGSMAEFIKDSIKMTRSTVLERSIGLTEESTKEIGIREGSMDEVNIFFQTESLRSVNGKTGRSCVG